MNLFSKTKNENINIENTIQEQVTINSHKESVSTINDTPTQLESVKTRLSESRLMACISGAVVLFASFGIRQTIGVFLIPMTVTTHWDRSTFSIAAGVFQLLWGFSQPFIVYLAERKFGFGKSIFLSCLFYGVGLIIAYKSYVSEGLFIFAYGIVVGTAAAGNSFPVVLASIGRRFAQGSKQQSVAFGIVSSFGSLGQCVFLPVSRVMVSTIGWQWAFVVLGIFMIMISPLTYFLRTLPAPSQKQNSPQTDEEKKSEYAPAKSNPTAPDSIKTALKEAFFSPTFLLITLGFTVCGFHVTFIATHYPAYLEDKGIDASLAAWTMSILGLGSMLGSMAVGYITNYISPRLTLTVLYLLRAILIAIFVFIPISVITVLIFSCLFGFLWLSTVPLTTKYVSDVFGQQYLGTLTSVTFAGHQVGSFLGAYVGGIVVDKTHSYVPMWYGSLALALFAVVVNFFAGEEPIHRHTDHLIPE